MNSPDSPSNSLPLVGWREWLSLPDLGVEAIKAKVDTGARSSALHTHEYEVYESPEGISRVRFLLHPLRGRDGVEVQGDAAVVDFAEVKDSGGHRERRPFIRTIVRLGEIGWPVDLNLTNRESMKFRMLLGRTAIRGRFLVDSACSYLQSRELAERQGTALSVTKRSAS